MPAAFLSVLVVACFALSAAAQDVPIKRARITLVPRTTAIQRITVENRRQAPLVALQLGLRREGDTQPAITHASDWSVPGILAPARKEGIQPNGKSVIEIDASRQADASSVVLLLAVFADGHCEGTQAAFAAFQEERTRRADDAAFWLKALEGMPRESAAAARDFLTARSVARAGEAGRDESQIWGNLQGVLAGDRPTDWTFQVLDRFRSGVAKQLETLRTPLSLGSETASVVLSPERILDTKYFVQVENLADIPIEAIGFRSARDRTVSDYCLAPRDQSDAHGRIQPRETRVIPLSLEVETAAEPVLQATFVIFDDGSFEGQAKEREALLRERELRAEDYAFAIAALREAAAMSAADAIAFLERTRSERSRDLRAQGRSDDTNILYDAIDEGKRAPRTFTVFLKNFLEFLDEQRQQLLRHRRGTETSRAY